MHKRKKGKAMRREERLLAAGMLVFATVVTLVNFASQIPAFWKSDAGDASAAEKIIVPVEQMEVCSPETEPVKFVLK